MKLEELKYLSEAADKDPEALLTVIAEAEKQMAEVGKALSAVTQLTSRLPGLFRKHIHAGNINNLDTPKEYSIWVSIENVKGLYSLNETFRETNKEFEHLKRNLKNYKK